VHIHEGRWQDILPKLVAQGVVLDGIYYDTFAEDYAALKEFFAEYVVQLLAPDGVFGWYNGLGADRQICYDVYTKVRHVRLVQDGVTVLMCYSGCRDRSVRSGLRHRVGRH
jgi:protein arginine N-methyltransferase 2